MENIKYDSNGKIIDILSGKKMIATPEEKVRQEFIAILINDYCYPKQLIQKEVPIQCGSSVLKDINGNPVRADIVVYHSKKAAIERDQGNILFVVECKKPNVTEGYNQLVSYIYNTSAAGGIWTNGKDVNTFSRRSDNSGLDEILSIPRYKEKWSTSGSLIPNKDALPHPHNIRFLLSSCHNKLYGRGMENQDFDLVMDMVRILLAKIQDESQPGEKPLFWITQEQYKTAEGRKEAAQNVLSLFRNYADQYPEVFDEHETIQVGNDCIVEAMGILQGWKLSSRNDAISYWDIMGEAYEQFTHIDLKRQKGQFFTNRLVVEMMVNILNPKVGENALDPAGGSGGFATAIYRHLRREVIKNTKSGSASRDRQLDTIKHNVFLVEIAPRLVKIAKCAMLLTGDGQSGMTRGNALADYAEMDKWIQARCAPGKSNAPKVIATNPPFSGQKTESQISDPNILSQFDFGHTYIKHQHKFSDKDKDILENQAPELLFLERCVNWCNNEQGRIGIVMPKGFLDGISYEPYRKWLLERCQVNAVITLHKDTFQPDTGVRTCVLFLSKKDAGDNHKDYPIFMAQSQRVGQDSKGNTIYKTDDYGNQTEELDSDLSEIAKAYHEFLKTGTINSSDYTFVIHSTDIKDCLNINPQHYAPKLNKALADVLEFNEKTGWSVTTIGAIEEGIQIYLGPRWKADNLKYDELPDLKDHEIKPFLTAKAVFEITRDSVKWLDISKADKQQQNCIQQLKVQPGDILITRSGSIGRIAYVTKDLARNYIISDDLIRVRVKNSDLRAYLLVYLKSKTAKNLMLRDEYGSVQQHLQPRHIQNMPIPIPDDFSDVSDLIKAGNALIKAMEQINARDKAIANAGFDCLHKNKPERFHPLGWDMNGF